MSMPLPIRSHFILDGNYIYVDGAGAIQQTSDSSIGLANPLRNPPSEWENLKQGWGRSKTLHGSFNKLTGKYEFTGDAAQILRYIIFTIGDTAKCKFAVYLVNDTVDWDYYLYQQGDINFEAPYINPIDGSVKIDLFEKGIASDFKSNLDSPYEIPLTGGDVVTIAHGGTTLTGRYNYKYAEASYLSEATIDTAGDGTGISMLLSATVSEGLLPVAISQTAYLKRMGVYISAGVGGSFFGSDEYDNYSYEAGEFIKASVLNFKVKLDWFASGGVLLPSPWMVRVTIVAIKAKDNDPFRVSTLIYQSPTYDMGGSPSTVTENINIVNLPFGDILEDERVYFVLYPEKISGSSVTAFLDIDVVGTDSKVFLTTDFDSSPSDVPGFRLHTLGEKLGDAFADGKYGSPALVSNYLSNPATFERGCYPQRIICTNGYALKGVADTKFKLTLQDYIDDVQANFDVGVGVSGDQIIIEHLSTFYDDTTNLPTYSTGLPVD